MPYRLSWRARNDLDAIWLFSAKAWPVEQADHYIDDLSRVFDIVADMPSLARERAEFSPPVRIHAHRKHLIIYTIATDHVAILRLLGDQQDWVSIFKAADF